MDIRQLNLFKFQNELKKLMVFWVVFGFSFLVALSGAMSPGPLLTYTIYRSIRAKKKGYKIGAFVCSGHAMLEFVLVIALVGGIAGFLAHKGAIVVIGLIGGAVLVIFGTQIIWNVKTGKMDFSFLSTDVSETSLQENSEESESKTSSKYGKNKRFLNHPILGGVLVSMSNPYWWMWWAVIGLTFMTQFSVSFANSGAFWGFYLGHEMGDIAWYVPVATVVGFSHKIMTKKIYIIILIACSLFMVGFGLYLAISPILTL